MNRKHIGLLVGIIVALVFVMQGAAAAAPLPQAQLLATRISGTLNIVSGDREGLAGAPVEQFSVVDATGNSTTLLIDPELRDLMDLYRLSGTQVVVTGSPINDSRSLDGSMVGEAATIQVSAIEPGPDSRDAEATPVTGNTKWVSIACKFADIADEPQPLSYFQNMYANSFPGLDAYWREASYDNINLIGSSAVGWFTLPKPMSAYQIDADTIRFNDLLADCAAAADAQVNFDEYMGINLMLNGNPGCCAWGGNRTLTLDGVYRTWSVTWLPPWSYEDLGYIQHEMTHAYGILWHSYAGDNAYGDPWDVVSNATNYGPGNNDPTYGSIGQHTQAYHRRYLGWLPEDRVLTVGEGETTVTLERTTQPGPTGYLMAAIPLGSPYHYYAIEARQRVGYDSFLKGDSITIHEILGDHYEVELKDPFTVGTNHGGYVWKVGDTWVAPKGGITVHVDAETATGFTVTIRTGLESRTMTLPATADSYIDAVSPATNFGSSTILNTRAAYDPF
ncbi:MAG: hypothetical protein R3C44_21385 [Chloroflexota bacterium]